MKNLMISDGCQDYGFDVHRMTDEDFSSIMSGSKGNVAFIEDIYKRKEYQSLFPAFKRMWYQRISNKDVNGIDGILFYESVERKVAYADARIDVVTGRSPEKNIQMRKQKCIVVFSADPAQKILASALDIREFKTIFNHDGQNIAFVEHNLSNTVVRGTPILELFKTRSINFGDIRSISGIVYVGFSKWLDKYPRKIDETMPRHYPIVP